MFGKTKVVWNKANVDKYKGDLRTKKINYSWGAVTKRFLA